MHGTNQQHFRRSGKKDGMLAVCGVSQLPLAMTDAALAPAPPRHRIQAVGSGASFREGGPRVRSSGWLFCFDEMTLNAFQKKVWFCARSNGYR